MICDSFLLIGQDLGNEITVHPFHVLECNICMVHESIALHELKSKEYDINVFGVVCCTLNPPNIYVHKHEPRRSNDDPHPCGFGKLFLLYELPKMVLLC